MKGVWWQVLQWAVRGYVLDTVRARGQDPAQLSHARLSIAWMPRGNGFGVEANIVLDRRNGSGETISDNRQQQGRH